MRIRALVGIALSATLAVSMSGCNPDRSSTAPGSKSSSTAFSTELSGTLKTSGYNPSDEVGKSRSDYATQQVAPVSVQMDKTEFDPQKFAAQAASGNVPDLISVPRSQVGTLADKELIVPLDECFAAWDVKPKDYYYPAALQEVTYDGKAYGVPQFFQPSVIIANKKVAGPAGVSMADLDTSKPDGIIAAAKKMTKQSGGNPTVLGFDPDLPGSTGLWLAVFGGRLSDDQGKPTLDDPKNLEALTWMKQLMEAQGGFTRIGSFKQTHDVFGDNNQYVKNQVGAQTWAQWYVNVLSNTKDKVSIEATTVKGKDGKSLGFAGGSALVIPKASKNPSAACAWAVKVTSLDAWKLAGEARAKTVKEKNAIFTGLFTGSPVADKELRDTFVKPSGNAEFDQVISTTYEAMENTVSNGGSPVATQIDEAIKNAVGVALAGEKSPQQALADAQSTAMRAWDQSNLAKRR